MSTQEKVDVVIVGSGAAGSVFAAKLATAGKSVKVLETGPAWKRKDLISSPMWARRLKWVTPVVEEKGQDRIHFNINAGRGFGGAALHHMGVWPRYQVEDFKHQSLYGKGLDWPLEYKDLRPAYDAVQNEVGIAGDAKAEVWRPDGEPYPLPPVHRFKHAEKLASGFEKLGLRTSPIPLAVLSRPYKGRPACTYDGWCDAGCPIDAIANPNAVYIPQALKAGAVMQSDVHVTRVTTNQKGDKATGVEYFDAQGNKHVQPAKVVVLCAFTVENVRILLNSKTDKLGSGLANSSGLLGRYLMSHPAVTVYGLFDEDIQSYLGASGGQVYSQDRLSKIAKKHKAFGGRHWEVALAMKPVDIQGYAISRVDLFGDELEQFMKKAARGLACMTGLCEDQPIKENRITLSNNKDKFGMPLAEVHYNVSPDGEALYKQASEEGVEIIKAAGASGAWPSPRAAQHIMGGTIMGDKHSQSVANSYSQTHDVDNLFLGGGNLFPTSSHANSTYTIHALAWRSAAHMVKNWSEIAG